MLNLDQYTLVRFLGKGTFGEVYLTQKEGSMNYYATKRMEKKMVDDPRYKKYFNNEISILRKLFHENIIRLEDLKVTKNHYYIIMEYCNGGSLNQCLNKYKEMYHRPFTEEIVQYIMRQVIGAVKYIHSQRIIHRDLKLDNILVNFLNQNDYDSVNMLKSKLKIIDFGFASSKDENDMFTTAIGSPLNMDPLILKKFNAGRVQSNDLYYDEKADIWSLGALCYQMLIGNSPFDAYNMQELVAKIEEGTYKVPTNLSTEVVSFLNGMLQYDPKKRLTAENLSNHAFLTKNVADFTKLNTNMISRNVYGGQLNINIKNNQSIWAIFNEADQKMLSNIPIDIYSTDKPLSESRYVPTGDNFVGITPEPHNELNSYFDKTQSVPIVPNNEFKKSNSTLSTEMSGGLNPPQVPPKNASGGPMQFPQQPQNQLQNNQNMGNNNNNMNMNPQQNINNKPVPPKQKMPSQIITFGNQIFSYDNQEPVSNKQIMEQQQNQINNPYMKLNYNNNNINGFKNAQMMQSPTVKTNAPPPINRFLSDQDINYPMNNNINNTQNNIIRGKIVNRAPYPQNMAMNRPMPNNQIPNQQGYNSRQFQNIQKNPVPNPVINQIGNGPNGNINTNNRPGQLNIIQHPPGPRNIQSYMYSRETAPKVNQIQYNPNKIMVLANQAPRTPTKGLTSINRGGAIGGQNIIRSKRPIMFRENPKNKQEIPRTNSFSNIITNQVNVNKNPAQISSNQKIQLNPQANTTNKKNARRIMQQPLPQNLFYNMSPPKVQVAPNMNNNIRVPGHFVFTQKNVS